MKKRPKTVWFKVGALRALLYGGRVPP